MICGANHPAGPPLDLRGRPPGTERGSRGAEHPRLPPGDRPRTAAAGLRGLALTASPAARYLENSCRNGSVPPEATRCSWRTSAVGHRSLPSSSTRRPTARVLCALARYQDAISAAKHYLTGRRLPVQLDAYWTKGQRVRRANSRACRLKIARGTVRPDACSATWAGRTASGRAPEQHPAPGRNQSAILA